MLFLLFIQHLFQSFDCYCLMSITSVCLIYFPESTADSKKSLGDINIPNTVSKSFNCPPIILKFFRSEISMVIEISIDFNLLGIVEFQIYHFILPILQANLGKKMAKILSRRVIFRNRILNQKILYNIFRNCGYSRISLRAFGQKIHD